MSKRETNICKCLAICLMFIHHLFLYPELLANYAISYGPVFSSPERLERLAELSKLCVTCFVFLTGYGTAMSFKGEGIYDNSLVIKKATGRLVKLLVNFQVVYVIAFALCPMGGQNWFSLYSGSRLENLAFAFFDFMGLSYVLNTPSYNSAWWYMSLAITLVLVLPWLVRLCRSWGAYGLLPLVLLLRWVNADFWVIQRYFLAAMLGVLLAEYGLIERFRGFYEKKSLGVKAGILAVLAAVFLLLAMLWPLENQKEILLDIYEAAMCLCLIGLMLLTVARIPGLSSAAEFIGRHSMNMFFVHAFIYQNWFESFVYSLGRPLFIFGFLLISTLLFSVIVEWLKKLLRVEKLAEWISGKLVAVMLPVGSR